MGIEIGTVVDYQKGLATLQLFRPLQNGDGIRIIGAEDSGTIITKMKKEKKQVEKVEQGLVTIPYQHNIKKGDLVLKTTDKEQLDRIHFYITKHERKVPISLTLEVEIGKPLVLTLDDGNNKVIEISNIVAEKPIKIETEKTRIQEQICKLGDSIYQVRNCHILVSSPVFIPIKELNQLRRNAIFKLNQKRKYHYPYLKCEYHQVVPTFPVEKKKSILISTLEQYNSVENMNWDVIYVENESLFHILRKDNRVIQKIPRVLHHISKKTEPSLVGELGTFSCFPQVSTDWSLNVVNSYSVAFLFAHGAKKVTLSYELEKRQIKLLIDAYKNRYHAHPNLELIIYGREEVMISKYHLLQSFHLKNGYLQDRFSNLYPIEETEPFMKIYNYKKRNWHDYESYYQMGINSLRYQLLDELEEDIKKVIKYESKREN